MSTAIGKKVLKSRVAVRHDLQLGALAIFNPVFIPDRGTAPRPATLIGFDSKRFVFKHLNQTNN